MGNEQNGGRQPHAWTPSPRGIFNFELRGRSPGLWRYSLRLPKYGFYKKSLNSVACCKALNHLPLRGQHRVYFYIEIKMHLFPSFTLLVRTQAWHLTTSAHYKVKRAKRRRKYWWKCCVLSVTLFRCSGSRILGGSQRWNFFSGLKCVFKRILKVTLKLTADRKIG